MLRRSSYKTLRRSLRLAAFQARFNFQVCREFQRGACKRAEFECRFAHPPLDCSASVTEDGYVTICMDHEKGRCARDPCRYFHRPEHLKATCGAGGAGGIGSSVAQQAASTASCATSAASLVTTTAASGAHAQQQLQLLQQQQAAALLNAAAAADAANSSMNATNLVRSSFLTSNFCVS